MSEIPTKYLKQIRRYEPVEMDGLRFYPILVEEYEEYLMARSAIEFMQQSLPRALVNSPILQAYYALDNLINNEWKTRLSVKAGKKGVVKLRGFKGNYKVSWTDADGNLVTREFYLKDDGDGITL